MKDDFGLTEEDYRVQEARRRVLAMQRAFPRMRTVSRFERILVALISLTSCLYRPFIAASQKEK